MIEIIEPLSETVLHVHSGKDGLKSFKKYLDDNKVEYETLTSNAGFQIDNHIWIHDLTDMHNLLHEGIHFLDYVADRLNIHEEREFRAYVGAYIFKKLIDLSVKEQLKKV